MDLRSWLSALGGSPAGAAAYGMAAPPVPSQQPMGLAVPPMARGTKLSAEMDYDGSHPRQQEQAARDHFRSYGPQTLMDAFIPGYGAGGDAKAASEAFGEGRYGAAAGNAAMAAVDFLPFLGALPAAAKGIRAFHGSPHDFDRFDMSKIGTGEGAQAYGHGLYFAESEGVAKAYRDTLSGDNVEARNFFMGGSVHPDIDAVSSAAKDAIRATAKIHPDNVNRIARDIEDWITAGKKPETFLRHNQPPEGYEAAYAAALEPWKGITYRKNKGSMYEVNIDADPADFLDWDAPLSAQGERVRGPFAGVPQADEIPGQLAYYRLAGRKLQSPETSQALREAGIPGIKYLDAGSRGNVDVNNLRGTVSMWEKASSKAPNDDYARKMLEDARAALSVAEAGGSRNYVVFDDRLITILRKYGIGGLIAGGGAYALTDAEYAQAGELLAQDGMNTGAR